MRLHRAAFLCAMVLPLGALAADANEPRMPASASPAGLAPAGTETAERSLSPFCSGEYADLITSMSRETRSLEASAEAGYTYCIRTVATYESVYYGKGGKLRRQYVRHVRHGTGFAYAAKDGEWLVATNEHVAQHPLVTESDSDVEGVPAGSRKVREIVKIVRNEGDDDSASQVQLTMVVADEALDLAVLKTGQPLKLMPHRIGRSSALRVGNAVLARGYPLGVFAAANTGRVISIGQPDHERGWDHEDFAIDAPLNAGNSGSPVFAVSCRTGELELVGVYHAGYKGAQSLNVVVAVDQLRSVLETLEPGRREVAREAPDRKALLARVRSSPSSFLMPFADRVVRAEVEGEGIRFALLDAGFPLTDRVQAELVDRGADLSQPSALVLPPRFGEREIPWAAVDATLREAGQRLHEALWKQLAAVIAFREGEALGGGGAQPRALAATATRIRARRGEQKEILSSVDFEAEDVVWPMTAAPAANGPPQGRPGGVPAPD